MYRLGVTFEQYTCVFCQSQPIQCMEETTQVLVTGSLLSHQCLDTESFRILMSADIQTINELFIIWYVSCH